MIAVCFARLARCRSMQLVLTFSAPSSNHLMERLSGSHETFFTFVNGFIQSMRLASSPQNPSGSFTERAYIASYLARSMKARRFQSSGTGMSVSDMAFPLEFVVVLSRPRRVAADTRRRLGELHRRLHGAPGAFARMLALDEEADGFEMGIVEHFVQRVGAHDGDAVLVAELHPFLDGMRHRGLALHGIIDADAAALRRAEEALALIGVRDAAQLHELRARRPAHRLDGDMPVLAFERPPVVGERGRVADMGNRRHEGFAIEVLGHHEAGEALEHRHFDELAFARRLLG